MIKTPEGGKHLMRSTIACALLVSFLALVPSAFAADSAGCVECHKKTSPGVVADWETSRHGKAAVGCVVCHGSKHTQATDAAQAAIPTPDTCGKCHEKQVAQYKGGKHSLAWAAMKAMPTMHFQPMALTVGMKGCGECHRIGVKTDADMKELRELGVPFGTAACNSCHTRHTFSAEEARSPEACETCHSGFDHAQWEMYSGSKHGVKYALKRAKVLPPETSAPTCQTCHMPEGNHSVKTAWGYLGVRFPTPQDDGWAADQGTILKALGIVDPMGLPAGRFDIMETADVMRMTQEGWEKERLSMIAVCSKCHSGALSRAELEKSDLMIKDADKLMAEAIRTVAGLYEDKLLKKPEFYNYPYPDLLTLHDAPTVIEQKLFVMFLEHRMRAFQGAFHNNPDYTFWRGWSEMKRDLTEIKALAAEMRERGRGKKTK